MQAILRVSGNGYLDTDEVGVLVGEKPYRVDRAGMSRATRDCAHFTVAETNDFPSLCNATLEWLLRIPMCESSTTARTSPKQESTLA
jgi:hypothetical protein